MSSLANSWFGSKTGVFARAVKKVAPLTLSCVRIMCGSNLASYIPPAGPLGISFPSLDVRGIFHPDIQSEMSRI